MHKLSSYNYFVPDKEKVVYLNGITSKMFAMSQTEHARIQNLLQDLEKFQAKFPTTFKHFEEWGFITNDDTDEIDILKYRNRQAVFADKNYMLIINPTLECNFKCWYCYEEHHQGFMSAETMEKIKKHIRYMIEKEKITSLTLSWFGGEPLLYFEEIIYPISMFSQKLCMENNIPFSSNATSNGYLIDKNIALKMKDIELTHFQITLDGDENRHNKIRNENGKPSFQKIVDNINLLLETSEKATITLRFNYDKKTLFASNWSNVFNSFHQEYRNRIYIDFQQVWQTITENQGENPKVLELENLCSRLGFQLQRNTSLFHLGCGCICYGDKYYHAEFNYDGKVYRCTSREYTEKDVMGELGDDGIIKWDEKKMAKRYSKAPFENKRCLACKYLALCLGLCSQKLLEHTKEELEKLCYLNHTDASPETMILNYYHYLCEHQKDSQAV